MNEIELIVKYWKDGLSVQQLASILGVSHTTVITRLRKIGLHVSRTSRTERSVAQWREIFRWAMTNNILTYRAIAQLQHVHEKTVCRWWKKIYGDISIKEKKKDNVHYIE